MRNVDLFDQYLKKELSDDARNDFNHKIKSDQQFAKEFAEHLEIKVAAKVTRSVKEADGFTVKPKIKKSKILIIFLFVLLSSIIALILIWNMKEKPTIDLFNEPIALVERSTNDNLVQDIETYYRQKDFDQTLILIDKVLEETPKNYELLLYKGISLRDSKNNPDMIAAVSIFNEIIRESTLEEKAQYHKAVTLYKNNQIAEAKILLKEIISESNHQEFNRASELLNKMNQME